MNLKELLGSSYKEGMTFEEAEKALSGKNLVDLSTGGYVSKEKYERLDNDYKNAESRFKELEAKTKNYDELVKFRADTEAKAKESEIDEALIKAGWKKDEVEYGRYLVKTGKIQEGEKFAETSKSFLKEHPNFGTPVETNEDGKGNNQTPPTITTNVGTENNGASGYTPAKTIASHPWNR